MADAVSVDRLLGPRVTLEEWIALAEDVPGEFIDGRLVEEEVPSTAGSPPDEKLAILELAVATETDNSTANGQLENCQLQFALA